MRLIQRADKVQMSEQSRQILMQAAIKSLSCFMSIPIISSAQRSQMSAQA